MKKVIAKVCLITTATVALSGCVGSNAVTGYVMGFNLKAVDNRYARGGLNILLSPVYGLSIAADYIIFNSLEFWTGTNPLNGKPHIFDSKVDDTYLDVNDKVDDSLKEAPVKPISYNRIIKRGELERINENTLKMDITYSNGETATLVGVRTGDNIAYYLDGQTISQTSMTELATYAQNRS
ncbi:DUF3332 family protein [Shewanella sp. Isolate11]|uniref:DUF3332 family protein n=1 Tax=Shewanella sp. Isolate11 TaxID=2908530 RepID=UPI001EFDF59F|nr:DUF3332 family protein [Shewanella sp. Isolate11]MCG9698428.1 DUF3332 domain-containing protein [Shewanella sp. Isolate11]